MDGRLEKERKEETLDWNLGILIALNSTRWLVAMTPGGSECREHYRFTARRGPFVPPV